MHFEAALDEGHAAFIAVGLRYNAGPEVSFGPGIVLGCVSSPFTARLAHEHPLVAPHVSHFSHVPFRTIVKFWHSEHMLPV